MSAQEILAEIQKLSPEERQLLLKALGLEIGEHVEGKQLTSEEEVERILLAEGIITEIPVRAPDEEEGAYQPIEVQGKPLSETIVEERR